MKEPDRLAILRQDPTFERLKNFRKKYVINFEMVSVGFDGYSLKYYMTLDNCHDSDAYIKICAVPWKTMTTYFETDEDRLFELADDGFIFHDKDDILKIFESFKRYCEMKNADYRINRGHDSPQHLFEVLIDHFVDAERFFLNFFTIVIEEFKKHATATYTSPELRDEERRRRNLEKIRQRDEIHF